MIIITAQYAIKDQPICLSKQLNLPNIAMAQAAAPYVHAKPGDVKLGKKEQAEQAAHTAGAGTEWGNDLMVGGLAN